MNRPDSLAGRSAIPRWLRPFLDRLYRHATRPEFRCRHRWRAGDLVIWDNRSTLHFAVNDYDGFDRLLYRTTFADDSRPFA